ncbi:hypothetical protein BC835DRAFT_396754 [Cytidiella melzeri]|nr:hypothetical protein BC835DRAFT_396754 [Cytidiella melzeri]
MSDHLQTTWNDVISMLGATLGVAGMAAVNFVLTAACLNALPQTSERPRHAHCSKTLIVRCATGSLAVMATTHASVNLAVSHGIMAAFTVSAYIALPVIAASCVPYMLYRRTRTQK